MAAEAGALSSPMSPAAVAALGAQRPKVLGAMDGPSPTWYRVQYHGSDAVRFSDEVSASTATWPKDKYAVSLVFLDGPVTRTGSRSLTY